MRNSHVKPELEVEVGGITPKGAQVPPIASKGSQVRPITPSGSGHRWGCVPNRKSHPASPQLKSCRLQELLTSMAVTMHYLKTEIWGLILKKKLYKRKQNACRTAGKVLFFLQHAVLCATQKHQAPERPVGVLNAPLILVYFVITCT